MNGLLPYLRLTRLPNVFTALADVSLGFLLAGAPTGFPASLLLLLVASAALYSAGMVLNDVFDYELDCLERPERPLPAEAVSLPAARFLGWSLLLFGCACGWLACFAESTTQLRSGFVATGLAVAIVTYDGWLKRTPLGPLGMGACRLLNVLLGASLIPGAWQPIHLLVASSIGLYIVGVTWFARTEAAISNRASLTLATLVMLTGIGLLGWSTRGEPYALIQQSLWPWLWGALGVSIGYRCTVAIVNPAPWLVQRAIKHAIMSLIVLDAAAAFSTAGQSATTILLLLFPSLLLGRWVYST
jgi:4-hydroxybenzoate polyprenyltransferase